GNVSAVTAFTFTLDTQAPVIALTSPDANADLAASARLVGTVSGTGSAITVLNYQIDGGAAVPVPFTLDTGVPQPTPFECAQVLDISRLATGAHTLTLSAQDAAGPTASTTETVTLSQLAQFTIARETPEAGSSDVGVTFRPQVFFTRPVAPTSLNA